MPFGSKPDPAGGAAIDFNAVYERAIRPGIEDAGMFPLRADEEKLGGIIHKAMFERLLVCDFAVADLTTSNPNVMYELGVRHAARPGTTLTVYAESSPLPFDIRLLRTQPYRLGEGNELTDVGAAELRGAVARHLRELRGHADDGIMRDSPLFQLLPGWAPEPWPADRAEAFQDRVTMSEAVKKRLRVIRRTGRGQGEDDPVTTELAQIRREAREADSIDAGVLTELMLTHRSLEDWSGMVDDYDAMPGYLQRQVAVRQQVAFAYNRRAEESGQAADRGTALSILEGLEDEQGPHPETSGLLGRIYKGQWLRARRAGDDAGARAFLAKAVGAYVRGFEADWRDVYPGVNAVTLLDAQGGERAARRRDRLLPVVRFAAEQRLRAASPDYWDHATMLEIAVLEGDAERAQDLLADVEGAYAEVWQPRSTADNIALIHEVRREQGRPSAWIEPIIAALRGAATR
jgi:hypothetical protein